MPATKNLKAGLNLNVVFPLLDMGLIEIFRSRFKQYKNSIIIPLFYVLGCFRNVWVIFRYIWEEIVFLKGLVKLEEISNFEDIM